MTVVSGADLTSTHVQRDDNPWAINIVDHPAREDSEWSGTPKERRKRSSPRSTLPRIPMDLRLGKMHHGGSLWVLTDAGWRMYLARAAIEWSLQFCADPAKVDRLRQDAKLLVHAFPRTIPALEEFGYTDAKPILDQKITDVDAVARYTDSLFNSCVPLSRGDHQGVLPRAAGEHYYPIPIKDGDSIRYDDFKLWVTIEDGTHAAVAPVAPRGSGDSRAELLYARHGTAAGDALTGAIEEHKSVILPRDHPVAREAFKHQH